MQNALTGDDVSKVASPRVEDAVPAPRRVIAGSQRRKLREALLAYLFLLPAFLIVGIFGLFPLIFAAYQSTLRGLNKVVGAYDSVGNYVRAIGNLAYVLGFWVAAILVYLAFRQVQKARQVAAASKEPFWVWALSGVLVGGAGASMLAWIVRLLPLLLTIPEQMRGARNTPENFRRLLWEALVQPELLLLLAAAAIALLAAFGIARLIQRRLRRPEYAQSYLEPFAGATLMFVLAVALFWMTWSELQKAVTEAQASGSGLDIWMQVVVISGGFLLLLLAWWLWQSASYRDSSMATFVRLAAAAMLMVGAWVLIAELPRQIGMGDETWWYGLLATFYYALGTIPAQLIVALLLATLLFQSIRGRGFFRVIYFLPYIAPFVGTAAVFQILFSSRPNAPVNQLLSLFNLDSLLWLNEPRGILNLLLPGADLPFWASGPSLALVVVMIFGVWTFFGFNTVIFLAGLGSIPGELHESAAIDGAGRWAQFRHVTLPMLSPTLYFLTLYSVIGTFKAFNHIYVLRAGAVLGTTDTASVVIFQTFRRDTRYGYASALAILLLLIIIVLTVINNRIAQKRVFYG